MCRGELEGKGRRRFFVLDPNGEESVAPVPARRGGAALSVVLQGLLEELELFGAASAL